MDLVTHLGGCHCGAVRFEVWSSPDLHVFHCNCSICTKKQNHHFIVPKSRFTLLQGVDNLTTYTFNTHVAKHTFCRTCGVQSFYTPRSNPDGYGTTPASSIDIRRSHLSVTVRVENRNLMITIGGKYFKLETVLFCCSDLVCFCLFTPSGVAPHCLDPGTVRSIIVEKFCGEQWEESLQAHNSIKDMSKPGADLLQK
ncbi:centromere protein V isoform X1 [Girardinichthys multiradiatus]|uniref:centromere protein V isoform X1 n=1 Tax=Girardinichthys multiradiatus TaxID=208333 RepID=UPI001FACC25C|nr:centromere protein V isoform X1 [Girardinichthys multiradiatus]XP_047235300.1 centromere protein V isoform X1 [Girardinichthys multiradiatus]